MKRYSDTEIIQRTNTAPQPVRDVIEDVQTALYIAELGQKYSLHIDKIGMLAELNRNMLLGLVGPEEFLQELVAAGIQDKDAREIMTEINQKIFVPLREQMKKRPPTATEPVKPVAPQMAPSRPMGAPAPLYARPTQAPGVVGPPPQSPSYFHLENKIPAPPKAMQGAVPVRSTQSSGRPPISNSAPLPPKSVLPPRAGLDPKRLLEDHEEPHIDIKGAETPLQQALRTVLPPANLPGVITHPPLTPPAPIAPPQPPLPPTPPKPIPPTPLVSPIPPKPYSADPYREPIDEK